MNKELINKYKPEFDHWLNKGKILYKYANSNTWWDNETFNDEPWDYSRDYITAIIIKDEYSEFRKALAEGKIIQINNSKPETWIDIDTDKLTNYNPSFLRIKPDEPKFKVGDFVKFTDISNKHPKQIIKIEDEVAYTEFNKCLLTQLILWTPVKGEWCWFFNDDRIPTISQFVEMDDDITRKYFAVYPNKPKALGSWYKKCEPFLNSLPSYLKDK